MFRSWGRPFEDRPFGTWFLTDEIEIPAQTHNRSTSVPTGDGKSPCLRETRGLQAQPEASEITGSAFSPRVACTEPHSRLQSRIVHTDAIIDDPYPALLACPFEMNDDLARVRRDGIVDEIG